MSTISRFRGIAIRMYFNEEIHTGRPHFHAEYGGDLASFDAADMSRLAGKLPKRIERLVREWAHVHQGELLANWERGRSGRQFDRIKPLK